METQALFTTSWDDGHPLDARVAELLSRHGLWEVESFDGWRQLDDFLRYAAERIPAERRLSNREVLRHRAANSR